MGVDYYTAKWLKEDLKVERGNKLLALGRQNWWLTGRESYKLGLAYRPTYARDNYADGFFRELGFDVESLDISGSEGAEIVHDMSQPVDLDLLGKYDVILDLGTAEHVADQRQYWENVYNMLSTNGRVFGLSPIDGLCGHGLYQISPEFFQNLGGFTSQLWITTCGPLVKTVPYTGTKGKPYRWRTYCRYILTKIGPFSMPVQTASMVTTSYKLPLDVAKFLLRIPGVGILRRTFL
jgi:hypothetical protein